MTPAVLGFVAPSGTGKTTLLCRLVPLLERRGVRVGAVKHSHHRIELDRAGKDSFRLREAGVRRVLLVSDRGFVLFADGGSHPLEVVLQRLAPDRLDLVLVEGYRGVSFPKIELYRRGLAEPPRYPDDDSVIAIASDDPLPAPTDRLVVPLSDPEPLAEFAADFAAAVHRHQRRRTAG